ncbi:FABP family protein [Streptomyces sp. NPDC091972]|uniref:FABP family protein n=1 Tax=Streptomyces sp. NPDC091972 TaxID=3366007 RepID=UPI0038185D20
MSEEDAGVVDSGAEPPFPDSLWADQAPAPHALLGPVLGFLGVWRGRGRGGYPTLDGGFGYAQEVRFSHDGRPFLRYEARAWLLDDEGAPLRPAARESGWWRLQPDGRVEALVTQPTGITEILVGHAGEGAVELATHSVALTPTAKDVTATRRRYTLADAGTLDFVHDLAAVGQPLQHHLSATLRRAAGQSTPPTSSWNSSVQ